MRTASLFLLLLSLAGCATMDGPDSLTSAADTESRSQMENRVWHEAKQADVTFERSGQVYPHAPATAYLQQVTDSLYPEFKGKIRVRIYDSTQLNAFAMPNGSIYVNLGMLARMENEAQLAALLAHEVAHFTEKHSIKQRVTAKNMAALYVSGIPFASLASISSISGYSRDLEREADAKGFDRMVKSGYDPREASKLFQHMADEVKVLEIEEPYFFSSHPQLVERIDEFNRLSAQHKGGGQIRAAEYNKVMSALRLDTLRKDIGQDRFQSVILVMEDKNKSVLYPAESYYYLGEAYMRRDESGDDKKALAAYRKAEKLAPKYAPTYMRLGMHHMKSGDKKQARNYFNRYLKVAPKDATERAYVQQYLKSL